MKLFYFKFRSYEAIKLLTPRSAAELVIRMIMLCDYASELILKSVGVKSASNKVLKLLNC